MRAIMHSSEAVVAADEKVDSLQFDARHDGVRMTIRLSGTAELSDSSQLTRVLMHYDAEAQRFGTERIDIDVRAVERMNSSALSAFVQWFSAMKERAFDFQVRFLSDPRKRWQRGSLHALATFAVGHVTVEAIPVIALPGASA